MSGVISNPRGLKLRRYSDRLIYINKYLDVLPGTKASEKNCVTELNEKNLNSMPNIWIKRSNVQVFDCGSITVKEAVNMF